MNHIYRLVRSSLLSHAQVAPETARHAGGTGVGTALAATAALCMSAAAPAWGVGLCDGVMGPITVSTAVANQTCILSSGAQLTVNATGSIDGHANWAVYIGAGMTGVRIDNNGQLTSNSMETISNAGTITELNNSGTISNTSWDGVFNSGTIGLLNNTGTGTIHADGWGVWNTGTITELRNAGTIEGNIGLVLHGEVTTLNNTGELLGNASAVQINHLGIIPTFNNSGLIRGGAGGAGAFAIDNDGALGTLNNSGWIDGRVWSSKAFTLNLQGTSARISGPVINPGGSVNLQSGATFTTESTFSSGTFSIHSGSTLSVAGASHGLTVSSGAANAFSNAGTLYVPEGVQANINGNYSQSGLLRIGASSAASHGRLRVAGNAELAAGAGFAVDVKGVNTLAQGEVLAGVLTATGTLTNLAGKPAVQDNSALFDFDMQQTGNAIDLRVVAGASSNIVDMVQSNGLPRGASAARVLDSYIQGGQTGTDWDAVVTALGQLPTGSSVAAAVGQTLPLLHGSAAVAGLGSGSVTSTAVSQQQALTGRSGGDGDRGSSPWVKPLGSWLDQDTVDGASGFKFDTHGVLGGVQADLGATSMAGLGAGYLRSKFEGKGYAASHLADVESLQLLGYGRHGLSGGWQLDWQGDYTRSRVDFTRGLAFIGRVAQGRYDSDAWHLGAGLSKVLALDGNTTLRPGVALDWRQLRSDAYTETGAGVLDLQVDASTSEEAILKVGAELQRKTSERLHWLVSAALGYDLKSGNDTVVARFAGGGPAFAIEGVPRAREVAELGVGMIYRPGESTQLQARYDLLVRKGVQEQRASVRFSWLF